MRTTNKKLAGGLLIGLIITAIGAVLTTAQTDATINETIIPIPPKGKHGFGPFNYNLTEEQQTELENLITTLREQNATRNETQAAIQEKLDEYGVLDTQLDNEITQTEQRLAILNRQKELRNQGYSWNEINTIIQEEFDLKNMTNINYGMIQSQGFRQGQYS
jgi:hypothetical protein